MIKRILNKVGSFIEFSSFERRGVFALLFVLLLFVGYYFIRNNIDYPSSPVDETALASYQKQLDNKLGEKPVYTRKQQSFEREQKNEIPLQVFNPNVDSEDELIAKGVPAKIAKNLVNYRNKGGEFRSKEDVAKLYAVDESEYAKLEPFIGIERNSSSKNNVPNSQTNLPPTIVMVDVNRADLSDLKKIPGIGDVLAERILKYRNRLGGFHSLSQLSEVYGISEEVQRTMFNYLSVDKSHILTIEVNKADFKSLLKHPYLDYQETKAIVNYIEQHGAISSLSEFKNLHIFKGKDIDRILPYLDLN